jgi:glycosyltransferase involved in cell wall biosynthesis
MSKSRVIIISPSGAFYGSEQVLFDYITHTRVAADVVVPANSILYKKLMETASNHTIKTFQPSNLMRFYVLLFFKLLFNRYRTVYLNEAGHVKYILLLAKILPKKKFVIHVRITEDAVRERWILKPGKNVTVLAISEYIAKQLPYTSSLLYDPYPFGKLFLPKDHKLGKDLKIGVIGRITHTKGVDLLFELLNLIKNRNLTAHYKFLLFGTMSDDAIADGFEDKLKAFENVTMCGFESSKEKIYTAIDCVMHLSKQEPLGRIFLETIDAEIPFIGINAAGIGEISTLLEIKELMADPTKSDLSGQLIELLEASRVNYYEQSQIIAAQKKHAADIFNIDSYTQSVDKLLVS